jgi:hypothetical protein
MIRDTYDDGKNSIRKALWSGGPSAPKEIDLPTTTMNIPKAGLLYGQALDRR